MVDYGTRPPPSQLTCLQAHTTQLRNADTTTRCHLPGMGDAFCYLNYKPLIRLPRSVLVQKTTKGKAKDKRTAEKWDVIANMSQEKAVYNVLNKNSQVYSHVLHGKDDPIDIPMYFTCEGPNY